MNWGSLHEFLDMGGYGAYVWGAYGMVAVVLLAEAIGARSRLARARRRMRRAGPANH